MQGDTGTSSTAGELAASIASKTNNYIGENIVYPFGPMVAFLTIACPRCNTNKGNRGDEQEWHETGVCEDAPVASMEDQTCGYGHHYSYSRAEYEVDLLRIGENKARVYPGGGGGETSEDEEGHLAEVEAGSESGV